MRCEKAAILSLNIHPYGSIEPHHQKRARATMCWPGLERGRSIRQNGQALEGQKKGRRHVNDNPHPWLKSAFLQPFPGVIKRPNLPRSRYPSTCAGRKVGQGRKPPQAGQAQASSLDAPEHGAIFRQGSGTYTGSSSASTIAIYCFRSVKAKAPACASVGGFGGGGSRCRLPRCR